MTRFHKLQFLLSSERKRQLLILCGLLFIGMLFEMAGLGILIPALGMMLNADVAKEYPRLRPFLESIGNPTQIQLVLLGMAILITVYLIKAAYLVFLTWRQSQFSAELSAELSESLFLGYLTQPYAFHLQRNSAELLRNILIEINQFTVVSQAVVNLSLEVCVVVGVAITLIWVEPLGAVVVMSFLAVTGSAFHQSTKHKLLIWGRARQFHLGEGNKHLLQGLGGVKDVKLLGRERFFLRKYALETQAFTRVITRVTTLGGAPRLYLELLAVVGLAGLILLMVVRHQPLELLLPTLGVFVAAAFRLIPSVNRMMTAAQLIRYSSPVVDVLYEEFRLIRHAESLVRSSDGIRPFSQHLTVDDLKFNYHDTASSAIDGVSLSIKRGESVGFIGSSGSGKSTLVDLILGLLTPGSGSISVDGYDIQDNIRGWQNQIGYVPQSMYLTDDSLRHNVAFGIAEEDIDDAAVERAVKSAQLDAFVASLPEGLNTVVGERGVRLSGGQRQRIGIARALYHDPGILVLDEATSALDTATEQGVMEAVNALHGTKTLIIVAHRLSTLATCDRIYRLDRGKVVAEGTATDMLSVT